MINNINGHIHFYIDKCVYIDICVTHLKKTVSTERHLLNYIRVLSYYTSISNALNELHSYNIANDKVGYFRCNINRINSTIIVYLQNVFPQITYKGIEYPTNNILTDY